MDHASDPFSFAGIGVHSPGGLRVPDPIEQTVADFISLHGMFAGADHILLAVSGGADSMAMLHILQLLRAGGFLHTGLVCAHVNHQLRGLASDDDERFVTRQAARLGLSVVAKAVDVRTYAAAHRLSTETAARRLRLEALDQMARSAGCAWVATGHQKNDNTETVIQRLRRGTGFRGLAGIRPVRRFKEGPWFASPLLCLTRDEIITYLRGRRLEWREDQSNADLTYTRNYIRHRLLPALQRGSHGPLVEELSDLAVRASGLYDRLQRDAEEAALEFVKESEGGIALNASGVTSLPPLTAVELIRQMLVKLGCGEQDLTEAHYNRILELARTPVSARAVSLPGGFLARREHDRVILAAPPQERRPDNIESATLRMPGETRFAEYRIEATILSRENITVERIRGGGYPFEQYFDLDRVEPPVVVRPRRAGDRFRPLGQDAETRLGKFLTAAKVPEAARRRVLIFEDQSSILWACPVRICESAKVTDETQRILRLSVT